MGAYSPLAGRELGDNVLEVEASLMEFSIAVASLPAAILFDVADDVPCLARRWMWCVLEHLGVCRELLAGTKGLDWDRSTTNYHQGCFIGAFAFAFASGVKQGCPLSGRRSLLISL